MLLSDLALGSMASHGLMGTAHGALASTRAMLFFQTETATSHMNTTLLMWFVGMAAFALLMQAFILLGMAIGGAKITKDLMKYIEEARGKAIPLMETTQHLVRDLTPQIKVITNKVEVIAGHVESISSVASEKVNEFAPTISAARITVDEANETVRDANRKTHEQVYRVNEMVTGALDSTARLGSAIQRVITMPGREVSGLVSGLKAGIDSLVHNARKSEHDSAPTPTGSPYRNRQPVTPYRSMAEERIVPPASPRDLGRR